MYRCGVCDAPALSRCNCLNNSGTIKTSHMFAEDNLPVPIPSEQAAALKRVSARVVPFPTKQLLLENKLTSSIEIAKVNVSSGEDAFIDGHLIEYAD